MKPGDDKELNTTHRAVLTGSVVVSAFADALRVHPPIPEKETAKDKDKEKEKERLVKVEEDMDISEHGAPSHLKQPPLTSSGTGTGPGMSTRKKEANMHAPHHCNKHLINSSELWGPVLVVCKSQDIRAWEEGLGAVFRSKNGGQKSVEPYNDIKHQLDKSQMDIDGMNSSSKGVYDEVINSGSGGQSASSSSSSSAGHAESRIQFVGYYGSDSDRAKIRAYITPNEGDPMGTGPGVWGGLYSERSPCHVMIANYESFLSDISDFSTILWHSVVFDSPWGLLSNTHSSKAGSYASFTNDITHLKCRHRIYSSSSLSNKHVPSNINSLCSSLSPGKNASKQSRGDGSSSQEGKVCVLPDLIACAIMLFPALQNIVQFLSDGDDITAAVADSQPGACYFFPSSCTVLLGLCLPMIVWVPTAMNSNYCLDSISSTHHASCSASSVLTNFLTHFSFELVHSSIINALCLV